MNSQTDPRFDVLKLATAVVFLLGGMVGYYHFEGHSLLLRVMGLLAMTAVAVYVALQTGVGRSVLGFVLESRTEMHKVVWPTRQETWQTTLFVAAAVLLLSLVLWLYDMLLMAIVHWLTGRGG